MEDNKMLSSICLRIVEGLLISVCTSCLLESFLLSLGGGWNFYVVAPPLGGMLGRVFIFLAAKTGNCLGGGSNPVAPGFFSLSSAPAQPVSIR